MTARQRDPAFEERRLAEIGRLEILDSAPEATFDRIASIIVALFDVPLAMITLVDRERCWYKAEIGLGLSEMSREDNMCDSVLELDRVLVINDAQERPAAEVLPLLKKGLRFYAGAPLRTYDGVQIGTVCAVGFEPRSGVSGKEQRILSTLAEIVVDEMELRLAARRMAEADEELRRLNKELEAASRNKSEFLASMSHELRTPLNGILGASELLGEGLFGELNEKQREYVSDIQQSGAHLLSLIDDVLDLSRIEAGQVDLQREPLDVALLMETCDTLVKALSSVRSVALVLEPPSEPLLAHADERRMTQVACNLLTNALKFTPAGGRVRFSAERKDGEVLFTVEDDGPGIAPEFHERIFEQFFRVASDQEGTGLGLPLSKRLVELQGGRIWVESAPGRGSRFLFTAPLYAEG